MLRTSRFIFVCIVFWLVCGPASTVAASEWAQQAIKLNGDSDDARNDAIRALRGRTHLLAELRRGLGGRERAQALDVITVLRLRELLPDLFASARLDETGFVYTAINSFIDSESKNEVIALYRERLFCTFLCRSQFVPQIVILDTFSRMGVTLSYLELDDLFNHSDYEVQSAVLAYVRRAVLREKRNDVLNIIDRSLRARPWQLRMQAVEVASEMPRHLRAKLHWLKLECEGETEAVVRDVCAHRLGFRSHRAWAFETRAFEGTLPIHEMHIAFGYKDARPARFVGDRYERWLLVQRLLKPCATAGRRAGGFRRDESDGDRILKPVRRGDQALMLALRITGSAVGPDDRENRKNPLQVEASRLSKHNFISGLERAETTFYVGHSRDGGGPDFAPPMLTSGLHVDYARYRAEQPGLKQTLRALRQARKNQRAAGSLGFISCLSNSHFSRSVLRVAPEIHLTTTPQLIYYADALHLTLSSLEREIESEYRSRQTKNVHAQKAPAVKVVGLGV